MASVQTRAAILACCVALAVGCGQPSAPDQLAKAKESLAKGDRAAAVVQLKAALQADGHLVEARLLLGQALLVGGDATGAQIELRKARDAGTPDDVVVPLLAEAFVNKGEFDRLIAEFSSAELRTANAQAELRGWLALAYAALGKLESARQEVNAALAADPKALTARLAHTRLLALERKVPEALTQADTLAKDFPSTLSVLMLRAELLAFMGGGAEAVKAAYEQVLAVDAKHLGALAALAQLAVQARDWPAAEAQLALLQRAHPKQVATQFIGAIVAVQKGDLNSANEKVQALLKVAPDDPRVNRLAGGVAFQRGNALQATAFLGKAMAAGGNTEPVRVLLARSQLQLGDPARALATLRPALENKQVSAEALMVAAEAHLQQGDAAVAAALFKKAAEADPNDARARTAMVLTRAGRDAVDTTEEALRDIGAGDKGVISEMALITLHLSKGNFDKAHKAIDALEIKQPGKPMPAMLRGRAELMRGDLAKARKYIEAAAALSADYVPAVMALAGLDVREGKREEAIKRFQKLVDRQEGSLEAEMALISLKAEGGAKVPEVISAVRQAVKRYPGEVQPRLVLARALLQAGQAKEAVAAAQDAAAAFGADPVAQEVLSRAHQAVGDMTQAQAAATKMASLAPNSPLPAMRLAEIAVAQGDLEAARQSLHKALTIRTDYLPAQRALVGLLVQRGKFADARAVVVAVQKQRPKDPVGWVLAGDVERHARLPGPAATAYREALKRREDPSSAVSLFSALVGGGEDSEAKRFADEWLVKHPKDVAIRLALAELKMAAKDWLGAEKGLEEVIGLQAENAVALNNLAWVQFKLNKASAKVHVEKALKVAPNAPPFLDTLAQIQAGLGQLDEALKFQRKAVEIDPSNAIHRFHLAEMLIKLDRRSEARAELEQLEKLGEKFPRQVDVVRMLGQLR